MTDDRTIEQMQAELAGIIEQLKPLMQRQGELRRQIAQRKSREFARANQITLEDVQLSSGEGVPYFGTCLSFGTWLAHNRCEKRFCEWNGILQFTAEAIQGRWNFELPGRLEDVPESPIPNPETQGEPDGQ